MRWVEWRVRSGCRLVGFFPATVKVSLPHTLDMSPMDDGLLPRAVYLGTESLDLCADT
uniref:Uncharacterized protein n=1 Tax=Arundo donax TaxID=35708 RepID=A0A0A9LE36_ARUDO